MVNMPNERLKLGELGPSQRLEEKCAYVVVLRGFLIAPLEPSHGTVAPPWAPPWAP